MKMRVEQVYPANPYPIAMFSIPPGGKMPAVGDTLRCGGYRFQVEAVRGGQAAHQFGLSLKSQFGIRPGMILRPADMPLQDDEFASMLARAAQLLQQLAELEVDGVLARMASQETVVDSSENGRDMVRTTDPIAEWLNENGLHGVTFEIFLSMLKMKKTTPSIEKQRAFAQAAGQINDRLGVIALKDATRAEIGS